MKTIRWREKWLALALFTGMALGVRAEEPVAVYEIGWDQNTTENLWHTVPKLVRGSSTIYFRNHGIKLEVEGVANGAQVFKTGIGTTEDLLSFTEITSASRRYVVKGEARCEDVDGRVSVALGISNANYAGIVGMASTAEGKEEWWEGKSEWRPFTITCDLQPALHTAGADPNQFIAGMGLKRAGGTGIGVIFLRNLRLEVYSLDHPASPVSSPYFKSSSLMSFGAGLGLGALGCLLFLGFRSARSRANHERELQRIASLDAEQIKEADFSGKE